MNNSFLFSIPPDLLAGFKEGSLARFGTIIKNIDTGQVVGHLQETELAQEIFGSLAGSPLNPLSAALTGSSVYSNVQLAQVKSMLESLELLQYANLGVSAVGLGVSAVGFVVINQKLNKIESQISGLSDRMDGHFQNLIERQFRSHYSKIATLFEKAEVAGRLSNPANEYLSIASQLADESGYFYGEVTEYFKADVFEAEFFFPLIRSVELCNAGRVECLLLAEEMNAAHKAAENIGERYMTLFDNIVPFELAEKITYTKDDVDHDARHSFLKELNDVNNLIGAIRDMTDVAITKPHLIKCLIDKGISGTEYLSAIRTEKEHPILLLKSN
jgi:hypothetical protein